MATRYRAKSSNFWDAVGAGAVNSWIHIDSGATGRITIVPATVATTTHPSVAIKPIILQRINVNTSGSSGSFVVSDSATGIICQLKASVAEKDYDYPLPVKGNLLIDPNGGDETVIYCRD